MIRPWKVFLSVAVGAAVLPCSAMAQAPTITITSPGGNSPYAMNATVLAAYSCAGSQRRHVRGHRPERRGDQHGDRRHVPVHRVGQERRRRHADDVGRQLPGDRERTPTDPGGNVPATLNLNLGTPTAFTAFVPGVAQDYTSTLTAQILSTAGDAKLTVADASDTNVGKMVNGAYALPQSRPGRRAEGRRAGDRPATLDPTAPAFKPLTGMSAPTELLTYGGPVSGSAIVTFKQAIAATDALRTGSYSKTLTFTLSTTNP